MPAEPLPVATTVSEILPGVFRWAAFSPHHKVELTAHAVWDGRTLLVFDPIPLADETVNGNVVGQASSLSTGLPASEADTGWKPGRQAGMPVPLVAPSLAARIESLRSLWSLSPRCVIVLTNENHERDVERWQQNRSAAVWSATGSTELPLEWKAFPLPGGAPGETAFFHGPLSLMVFGDAVVNLPERGLELLPAKYCRDQAELRRSLNTLPPFEHAVFAHGQPLLSAASGRIAALL